eukprot:TRINITY_DN137_c5_g1_i1.p1 TRINITY_DN137_c5_g1~~TRINITY_DN137_c5_g1_i1.p1  ORF type:complete len:398 (+),score=72.82 TRINITY_DN137_c5_g1_i1:60-1196(+)
MGIRQRLFFWRKNDLVNRIEYGEKVRIGTADADDDWNLVYFKKATELSDYESYGVIGEGATATVHVARQKKTDKIVALKIMNKKKTYSSMKSSSLTRERDIMATVKSRFVCKMYEAFQSKHDLVFAVEYMAGGDLYSYQEQLPHSRLDEATSKYYAAQLAFGILDLHKQGVAYRDLKPENILLDSNGNLKIADFGLSRFLTADDERCRTFVGTCLYMAPELIKGEAYTSSIDWWSYGVVVYGLLTGMNPFNGNTFEGVFKSVVSDELTFPSSVKISDDAKDFISKIIVKDPTKRLSGDDVMSHPWMADLDLEAIRSRSTLPPVYNPRDLQTEDIVRTYSTAPVSGTKLGLLTSKQQQEFKNFDFQESAGKHEEITWEC